MNILTQTEVTVDGAPLLRTGSAEEEEFLMASFRAIELHIQTTENMQHNGTAGTLYVTTKRVLWIANAMAQRVGYGWDMSQITLHAISRDLNAFPRPCLYCQVDIDEVAEVRFVPADPKQLQELFDAFSRAAELNPAEDDEDGEGGDDDEWIYDEDEVANGARAAQIAAHLDSVLHIAPEFQQDQPEAGQFDDADEDDELL